MLFLIILKKKKQILKKNALLIFLRNLFYKFSFVWLTFANGSNKPFKNITGEKYAKNFFFYLTFEPAI